MEPYGDPETISTAERRRWPRHEAVEKDSNLFWDDENKVKISRARLVNISRGGALLVAGRALPEGKFVRLGLNRAVGGVDGHVVSATMVCPGEYEIRLDFCEMCPGEFFNAAVRGIGGQ